MGSDVRSGVDFGGFARGDYRPAGLELRGEWAFWRRTAPLYRFGRTELLPIRSTEEGIGRYVGKYFCKHYAVRKPEDKGARLVGYSQGWRMATTRFSWSTPGAREWRRRLRMFTFITAERYGVPATFAGLRQALRPR
jgi:hypothetical protein